MKAAGKEQAIKQAVQTIRRCEFDKIGEYLRSFAADVRNKKSPLHGKGNLLIEEAVWRQPGYPFHLPVAVAKWLRRATVQNDEAERPVLRWAHVQAGGGLTRIYATDGHIMHAYETDLAFDGLALRIDAKGHAWAVGRAKAWAAFHEQMFGKAAKGEDEPTAPLTQFWQIVPKAERLLPATVSDSGGDVDGVACVDFICAPSAAKTTDGKPLITPVSKRYYQATTSLTGALSTFVTGKNRPVVYTGVHGREKTPVMAMTMPLWSK